MIEVIHFKTRDGDSYSVAFTPELERVPSTLLGLKYAQEYACGKYKPFYPVPAIPLRVCIGDDYMHDTVYIETTDDPEDPVIVCLWDFNFDHYIDFGTPYGEYQAFPLPSRAE